MNTKKILIAALLAAAFTPALASASEPNVAFELAAFDNGGDDKEGVVRERVVVRDGEAAHLMAGFDNLQFNGHMLRGRTVKNAPYSGEAVTERLQNLSDGNQITKSSTTVHYRDSAGRTRQETRDDSGKVRRVTIHDTVEGITYILNPESKTVTKIGPMRDVRALGDKARAEADKARAEADKVRAEMDKSRVTEDVRKGPNGEHIIIKRVERGEGELGKQIREDVRIRLASRLDGMKMPGLEMIERMGPMLGHFGDSKWSRNASVKDLGSKDIDGVKAQGKLRSYDIPAGEIGNKNPIIVSTETWYSPELQVTMYSKHSDPRNGERIYRLASLKRDEPAAALFAIPSDYKVIEPLKHQVHKVEIKK